VTSLVGKVAAVTGAGSGLGRACAVALGAAGAAVVANDVALDGLRETADEVVAAGGQVEVVVGDIRNREDVTKIVAAAHSRFDGLDIMIANAGVSKYVPFEEATEDDLDVLLDTNLRGALLCAQAAIPALRARRGGSIVFIGSKNALAPGSGASAYSSAKAAELHLARCLAEELGPDGIRINVVNPDAVLEGSRIWDSAWREERARGHGIEEGQLEDFYRARTTLRVNIVPADVAEAVLFFASPQRSGKSTGNLLNVDGGVAGAYPR